MPLLSSTRVVLATFFPTTSLDLLLRSRIASLLYASLLPHEAMRLHQYVGLIDVQRRSAEEWRGTAAEATFVLPKQCPFTLLCFRELSMCGPHLIRALCCALLSELCLWQLNVCARLFPIMPALGDYHSRTTTVLIGACPHNRKNTKRKAGTMAETIWRSLLLPWDAA